MKNKIKTTIWLAIFLTANLMACDNKKPKEKPDSIDKVELSKNKTVIEVAKQSNAELLQGKWVNDEDKTNFLVFENNIRKEIAGDMDTWDEEEYILSDKCEIETDNSIKAEKDSYITCKNANLCWYIASITKENLTLTYLGRGNTLNYHRVKE